MCAVLIADGADEAGLGVVRLSVTVGRSLSSRGRADSLHDGPPRGPDRERLRPRFGVVNRVEKFPINLALALFSTFERCIECVNVFTRESRLYRTVASENVEDQPLNLGCQFCSSP